MATPLADKVKLWLFPGLVSILGLIIWSDLQTIKTKLDTNTNQTTTDKANITNLENRMNKVEAAIFKPSTLSTSREHIPSEPPKDTTPAFTKIVAIRPNEKYYTKTLQKTNL